MIKDKGKLAFLSLMLLLGTASTGCHFMDIVPDNIATIEKNGFDIRSDAKKFLYTCYSYMPDQGNINTNPGLLAGGEMVKTDRYDDDAGSRVMRGFQNVSTPFFNYWSEDKNLYQGIRTCNVFLENIGRVPDISLQDREKWVSEVKFLKAYYIFYLVRMYGPVYLPKKNLPVYTPTEYLHIIRSPVDECFKYIVKLLDEAAPNLPDNIENEVADLGRVTKVIDYAVKAEVLVTAASPMFNGNEDYAGFKNSDGKVMFDPEFDPVKWDSAAVAAKKAIDLAQELGYKLYYFNKSFNLGLNITDTTRTKLSIRNSVTEKWNSEILWANTTSNTNDIQQNAAPRWLKYKDGFSPQGRFGIPLSIVELFYTNHGVPIKQDKTWDYANRYKVQTTTDKNRYNLKSEYQTAYMNFNREPRFYADLGFDGGIWFGQGNFDDQGDVLYVQAKNGQQNEPNNWGYSFSGYWPKKLFSYMTIPGHGYTIDFEYYPWPIMRLSDLFLWYAEAKNEADGPGSEVYNYINLVRKRAGIPTVQEAWTKYSKTPDQYKTKDGLREIIHRERRIELAFEGENYWALRRWKEGVKVFNRPIEGWSILESTVNAYYRKDFFLQQKFTTRDYLWPLSESVLLNNSKITQNPGWGL